MNNEEAKEVAADSCCKGEECKIEGSPIMTSRWSKEDLPTWSQFMNEFYLKKIYFYDVRDTPERDPYWLINKRQLILALACNQLNKMIIEDGLCKNELLRFFITTHVIDHNVEMIKKGMIYTLDMPNGDTNPSITNWEDRSFISNLPRKGEMMCYDFRFEGNDPDHPYNYFPMRWSTVERIIMNMIDYFNEPIGWNNGKGSSET
jgi:hypothetical protein